MCTLRFFANSPAVSRYRVELQSEGIAGAAPVRVEFELPLEDAQREW